jgi:cytochrome c peroxidase
MDPLYATRGTTGKYRTTPLRALWQHPPYFHDGSAESLEDVVNHYNRVLKLRLTDRKKRDLVEFLKTL